MNSNIKEQLDALQKRIDEIEKQMSLFIGKRVFQQDIIPGAVKQRHMGEPNKFVRAGLATDKPTSGETATGGLAMYYDTTNHKLWIFDGVWKYAQFT